MISDMSFSPPPNDMIPVPASKICSSYIKRVIVHAMIDGMWEEMV
jgi:hypothetical protein